MSYCSMVDSLAVPFLYWLKIYTLGTKQVEEHLVEPHLYVFHAQIISGRADNNLLIVIISKVRILLLSLYTSVHSQI